MIETPDKQVLRAIQAQVLVRVCLMTCLLRLLVCLPCMAIADKRAFKALLGAVIWTTHGDLPCMAMPDQHACDCVLRVVYFRYMNMCLMLMYTTHVSE